jgi:hypothetical protein
MMDSLHCTCIATSALVWLCAVCSFGAPPANDNFASRIAISGASGTTHGNNVEATGETGEQPLAHVESATNTVWWQWTAPADGWYGFETFGSTFNTVLGIFQGNQFGRLASIATCDDARLHSGLITFQSYVLIPARAGQTLQIAVAGKVGWHEGDILLRWYPDTRTWLDTIGTSTQRVHEAYCTADGSALSWYDHVYRGTAHGTNRGGVVISRPLVENHVENLTLHDKSHVLQAFAAHLDGMGNSQYIADFDGKHIVAAQHNGGWMLDEVNTLHALKARRSAFQDGRYTPIVSNLMVMAALAGARVFALSLDMADYERSSLTVMKRTLKRALWAVPNSPGLPVGIFRNGLLARQIIGPTDRVEVSKKGEVLFTRDLPAVPYGSIVQIEADRHGGFLYWPYRAGTNGPMTYLDKRGRAIFSGFIPAGLIDFNGIALGKRILLLERWELGAMTLRTYKLGTTPELLGEVTVPYAIGAFFSGSSIVVSRAGGGTAGVRVYDRKLRRIRWETTAPGYTVWQLRGSTHVIVSSNASTRTYTVYRKTRVIATHTYVP